MTKLKFAILCSALGAIFPEGKYTKGEEKR